MKSNALPTLLCLALICFFPDRTLPAAESNFGLELMTATDGDSMLRRTELKVALKQYEKILTELYDARIEASLGPAESGLTDKQLEAWLTQSARRIKVLESSAEDLRSTV